MKLAHLRTYSDTSPVYPQDPTIQYIPDSEPFLVRNLGLIVGNFFENVSRPLFNVVGL